MTVNIYLYIYPNNFREEIALRRRKMIKQNKGIKKENKNRQTKTESNHETL